MKKLSILLLLMNCVGFAPNTKAVSEAAVLFLLIQPSIRANGMAGTSVASSQHEALSVAFNPAHIGLATLKRSFNLEFYPGRTNWLPQFDIKGLNYDAKSILLGYNLKRLNKHLPLSIAMGYTRIVINLGEQIITGETGPEPLGAFTNSENADIWTFGIGFDYFVQVGLGWNFKNIESELAGGLADGEIVTGRATANAHDFGILVHLPVIKTISKLTNKQFKIGKGFYPFFKPGFGFSKSNIGDEISYIDAVASDPLPRVARMGFSINTGFSYSNENNNLRLLSFEWSSEAEDLLVRRDASGNFSYESGVGEIDFFENVIKARANQNVANSKGWELNLLDSFSIRSGRHEEPDGNVFYDAFGFGISLTGLIRFAGFINPQIMNSGLLSFLSQHVDIEYNYSNFDAGRGHPLDNTSFNGVKISLF
ncbi:MAG: hypothetical protein ACE5NG_01075 [bacterium]